MCNFQVPTTIGCWIISPWNCNFSQNYYYLEHFSYTFVPTDLEFQYDVNEHIKFFMCNFHLPTVFGCWIISPWTCNFYKITIIWSISPTLLYQLIFNLNIILMSIWSCACPIFKSLLPLVAELSPLELVIFTKLVLYGAFLPHFVTYWW